MLATISTCKSRRSASASTSGTHTKRVLHCEEPFKEPHDIQKEPDDMMGGFAKSPMTFKRELLTDANLSSGSASIRKALLERGLVQHLVCVLSTMVHTRLNGLPFSNSLPSHSLSIVLGCLSNLLAKNRAAKQAFLYADCHLPPVALLVQLLHLRAATKDDRQCTSVADDAVRVSESLGARVPDGATEEELFNTFYCVRALSNLAEGWSSLVEHGALEAVMDTGILDAQKLHSSLIEVQVPKAYSMRLQIEVLDVLMGLLAPAWETAQRAGNESKQGGGHAHADAVLDSDGGEREERALLLAKLRSKIVLDERLFDTCIRLCKERRDAAVLKRCCQLLKLLVSHACLLENHSALARMQRILSWCCGELGLPLAEEQDWGEWGKADPGDVASRDRIIDAFVAQLAALIEVEIEPESNEEQELRRSFKHAATPEQHALSQSTLHAAATLASQRGVRGLSARAWAPTSPKSSSSSPAMTARARTSAQVRPGAAWSCPRTFSVSGAIRGGAGCTELAVSSGDNWHRRLSFGAVGDVLREQARQRDETELEAQEAGVCVCVRARARVQRRRRRKCL